MTSLTKGIAVLGILVILGAVPPVEARYACVHAPCVPVVGNLDRCRSAPVQVGESSVPWRVLCGGAEDITGTMDGKVALWVAPSWCDEADLNACATSEFLVEFDPTSHTEILTAAGAGPLGQVQFRAECAGGGRACFAGPNEGTTCTVASECPNSMCGCGVDLTICGGSPGGGGE